MEESFILQPNQKLAITLKSEDTYEVGYTPEIYDNKVLVERKMISTGEWTHTFTNTRSTEVVIRIFRK